MHMVYNEFYTRGTQNQTKPNVQKGWNSNTSLSRFLMLIEGQEMLSV